MCFRRVSVVVMVFLLGCCVGPLMASAGRAVIRRDADASRDLLQTVQARKLLMEDPNLADLNIGVIVKDRVAFLWGPVSSAEIAFRGTLPEDHD